MPRTLNQKAIKLFCKTIVEKLKKKKKNVKKKSCSKLLKFRNWAAESCSLKIKRKYWIESYKYLQEKKHKNTKEIKK